MTRLSRSIQAIVRPASVGLVYHRPTMPTLRSVALAALALVAACSNGNTAALEALIEVKLEMRAVIDDLKQVRVDLEAARNELERARSDIDKARRSYNRTTRSEPSAALDVSQPDLEALAAELAAGVTCQADGQCTVKRALLDKLYDDPVALSRTARVVPSIRDGREVGFKLYGIRLGSLPRLLGFKSGDLITSVNDKPVHSLDSAMEAFRALGGVKTVKVVGERRGEPLEITVTLAD